MDFRFCNDRCRLGWTEVYGEKKQKKLNKNTKHAMNINKKCTSRVPCPFHFPDAALTTELIAVYVVVCNVATVHAGLGAMGKFSHRIWSPCHRPPLVAKTPRHLNWMLEGDCYTGNSRARVSLPVTIFCHAVIFLRQPGVDSPYKSINKCNKRLINMSICR